MRFYRLPLLVVLACLLAEPAARAQTPEDTVVRPPSGPLYPRLFPNPTGRNGYEELMQAADIPQDGKLLDAAMLPGATLTDRRAVINAPAVQKALLLVRQGLAKPCRSPNSGPAHNEGLMFEEFSRLRALGRLLMVEQYVLLADGKVGAAIDSMRDGLRLGYMVQSEQIIGSLVGVAIDGMVVIPFAKRLDQLSARDCDRLLALAKEWLQAPDPAISALAAEKEFTLRKVADMPQGREMAPMFSLAFEQLIAELRRPYWERADLPPAPVSSDSIAAAAFRSLWDLSRPAYARTFDKWTHDLTLIRLLGVHAAIRRYRWEYDRLPAELDELKLGPLALDPFTGKPLTYRVTSPTTYELSSAGPVERDDNGRPTSEKRTPVILPRAAP